MAPSRGHHRKQSRWSGRGTGYCSTDLRARIVPLHNAVIAKRIPATLNRNIVHAIPQRPVTLRTHIADHNDGRNRGNVKSADHQRTLRTGQSETPLDGREHDAIESVLQEAHDAVGVTQTHRIPDGPVEPLSRFWAPFAPAVT